MTKQYLLLLLIVISFACDPKPNSKELIVGDPELIQNTTNGQKFIIGNLNDSEGNYMYVANLKGTPFEMGKAFG